MLKTLSESILGIERVRDLGQVDSTVIGHTRQSTALGIVRCNGKYQLQVTLVTKGVLSRHSETFHWSLDSGNILNIQRDLCSILTAMTNRSTGPVCLNIFVRGILRLLGCRPVFDLGTLDLTDGVAKVSGFVVERKGCPILVVKRIVTGQTSYSMIPKTAVQAILETLKALQALHQGDRE